MKLYLKLKPPYRRIPRKAKKWQTKKGICTNVKELNTNRLASNMLPAMGVIMELKRFMGEGVSDTEAKFNELMKVHQERQNAIERHSRGDATEGELAELGIKVVKHFK